MSSKDVTKTNTQAKRVLAYCDEHTYITRWSALVDLGIANLTAVISDMRKHGIEIVTEKIVDFNRYGEKIIYARYYIKPSRRH